MNVSMLSISPPSSSRNVYAAYPSPTNRYDHTDNSDAQPYDHLDYMKQPPQQPEPMMLFSPFDDSSLGYYRNDEDQATAFRHANASMFALPPFVSSADNSSPCTAAMTAAALGSEFAAVNTTSTSIGEAPLTPDALPAEFYFTDLSHGAGEYSAQQDHLQHESAHGDRSQQSALGVGHGLELHPAHLSLSSTLSVSPVKVYSENGSVAANKAKRSASPLYSSPGGGSDSDSSLRIAEQRRQVHIQSEQKRRAQIKDGFEELRVQLPQCMTKKISKAQILSKTTQYIQQLKSSHFTLAQEVERLQAENERLRQFKDQVMQQNALNDTFDSI